MDYGKTIFGPVKKIYTFFLFFLPLAMVFILAARNLDSNGVYYCADQSELLQTSSRLLHGVAVNHGPPSRNGLHHLGPLFYYWLAFLTFLSGGNYILLKLAYAVTFAAGFVAYVSAQRRMVGAVFFPFAAALAFYFHPLAAHYLNAVWGPSILLVIMPLLFLVEVLVLEGRWLFLPAWVALASFAVQTHYGTGPLVFLLGLVLALFTLLDVRRHREHRKDFLRSILRSAGLLLFLWIPTMVETVQKRGKNIEKLYMTFFANNQGQGIRAALATFHSMLRDGTGFEASLYLFWATLPLLAGLLILKPEWRRSAGRWIAVYAAVLVSALYSFYSDPEPVLYYYVYYYNLFFLAEIGFAFLLAAAAFPVTARLRILIDFLMASLLLVAVVLPRISLGIHRYSSTSWNPCPYGEMHRVAKILKEISPREPIRVKMEGTESEDMTVPLLRLFEDEKLHLSWGATNIFVITSPVPADAKGIFVGERILLTKEPSGTK